MDAIDQTPGTGDEAEASGCANELTWVGTGLVLPCFSAAFYQHAVRRRSISALTFYFILTSIVTLVLTLSIARTFLSFNDQIQEAFLSGAFPEIVIKNGIAFVDAPQPFEVFRDETTLVIFDTTGEVTFLDRTWVEQGVLLTRNTLHFLSRSGEYQQISLAELQTIFGQDPIVISAATMVEIWGQMSTILLVIAFFSLATWHILLRFLMLMIIGLVMWGLTALIAPGKTFSKVLVIGIYAIVPTLYSTYVLNVLGVRFIGLSSMIMLAAWGFGLVAGLSESLGRFMSGARDLRMWRAVLGIPFLIVICVNQIFMPANGSTAVWVIGLLTSVIMVVASYLTYDEAFSSPEPASVGQEEIIEGPREPS